MDIKRTFACALIAMPLLVACNNDDKIGDDDQQAAPITIQDLAGEWNLTLVNNYENGITLAIIVNGNTAYTVMFDEGYVFTKQ